MGEERWLGRLLDPGPRHPPRNEIACPTPPTLAWRRWTVVSVPFYEWNRLRSLAQKQAYLREKLAPAVEAS